MSSLNFDRCGEALAVGASDSMTSIFDAETTSRIRNLSCHSKSISAISWNKSKSAPYILATASEDSNIVFHDVR